MTKKIFLLTTLGLFTTAAALSGANATGVINPREIFDIPDDRSAIGIQAKNLVESYDDEAFIGAVNTDNGEDDSEDTMGSYIGVSRTFGDASVSLMLSTMEVDVNESTRSDQEDIFAVVDYSTGNFSVNAQFNNTSLDSVIGEGSSVDDNMLMGSATYYGDSFGASLLVRDHEQTLDGTNLSGTDFSLVTMETQATDLILAYQINDNMGIFTNVRSVEHTEIFNAADLTLVTVGGSWGTELGDESYLTLQASVGTSEIDNDRIDTYTGNTSNDTTEEEILHIVAFLEYEGDDVTINLAAGQVSADATIDNTEAGKTTHTAAEFQVDFEATDTLSATGSGKITMTEFNDDLIETISQLTLGLGYSLTDDINVDAVLNIVATDYEDDTSYLEVDQELIQLGVNVGYSF